MRVRQVRMPRRECRFLFRVCVRDVCVRSERCAVSAGFYFLPALGTVISPPARPPISYVHRLKGKAAREKLCESRGGRPGLSVLTSIMVSVDVKLY